MISCLKRIIFGFAFLWMFCVGILAQDSIKYSDKVGKKGDTELNGKIESDSVKGLTIKGKEGLKLIPSVDIISVNYNSSAISSIELKSALGKEVRAFLPNVKDSERLKLLQEAVKDISDIAPKAKSDSRLSKYLSFRVAKVKSEIAKLNPEAFDDAVKSLAGIVAENPDSWMTLQALKAQADLYEGKGDVDKALKSYQSLSKLPGVPPEVKIDSDFLVLKLLFKANRLTEAETKLADVEKTISPGDPRRVQVVLVKSQVKLAKEQLDGLDKDLADVLEGTDESFSRAKALNLLGEYYLKKNLPEQAFWQFLKVDTLYSQDAEEHSKALFNLMLLFDKTRNDPIRSRQTREKLLEPAYKNTEYQKKAEALKQ